MKIDDIHFTENHMVEHITDRELFGEKEEINMKVDEDYVINIVTKALDYQFEIYSWSHMIDDCDLTNAEKDWAKEHLSYKLEILK